MTTKNLEPQSIQNIPQVGFSGFPFCQVFPMQCLWDVLDLLKVMNKSPAFQFYPNDWLSSPNVTLMTPEQEGAYIHLLCYDWANDGIPDDDSTLAALSRLCEGWFAGGSNALRKCFVTHPRKAGYLTNPRLEGERSKQAEWVAKSSAGGKKSGQARAGNSSWGRALANKRHLAKGGSQMVEPNANRPVEPNANSSSSSSSSSSDSITPISPKSKNGKIPTMDAVKLQCAKIGIPESEGERFMDYYESNGWRVGKNHMKSWTHALTNWKRNWEDRGGDKTNGNAKPSTWATKTSLDAKRERMKAIRDRHYSQTAMGGFWDDDKHRLEYLAVKRESEALEKQL